MRLRVHHRPDESFEDGSKSKTLTVKYKECDYEISIQQSDERVITVTSLGPYAYPDLLGVYYQMASLLMLLDGRFCFV